MQELIKKERKSQKLYSRDCKLLVPQDSWQTHQILLIILVKQFINLNVDMDTMIKMLDLTESNAKIASAFLITETLKMI